MPTSLYLNRGLRNVHSNHDGQEIKRMGVCGYTFFFNYVTPKYIIGYCQVFKLEWRTGSYLLKL